MLHHSTSLSVKVEVIYNELDSKCRLLRDIASSGLADHIVSKLFFDTL